MKKFLALLLALLTILSFAACDAANKSTDESNNADSTEAATSKTPNFNEMFAGNGSTDYIWGKQDAVTKQELIAVGKQSGIDISFSADGTMTMYDTASKETIIQKPDGTWVFSDEDGNEAQLGGSWPDNEFTKLLPKPSFSVATAGAEGNEFAVTFADATKDTIKAYTEQIKAKGFTLDPETTDMDMEGTEYYVYTASNADGYTVSVFCTAGMCGLTMTKPQE